MTDEQIDAIFGRSRFIARRKMDKSAYEVVRPTNEDWQDVIEDHVRLAEFGTFEEAQTMQRRLHVRMILETGKP